jgi:cytochrome c-type biogenesis protein CcmE
MNKTIIAALILIVGAIFIFINASKDVSTYGTFEEALSSRERMEVVGTLSKDKEMIYDPVEDPNYFSFYMKDGKGQEEKVILLQSKPQDFELSEQIVLTGQMGEDGFVATDILMKCPSKYKDEEIYLKSEAQAEG